MKSFFSVLINIFFVCLLLFVFALAFVFLARYTNGFSGDVVSFYLKTSDGDRISGEDEVELTYGQRYVFYVVYTFGFITDDSGYTIQVIPNITDDTNFDFTLNGNNYSYSSIEDLTIYFDIVQSDSYFTIKANMELSEMLALIYGSNVSGVPDTVDSGLAYYTLVVQSDTGVSVTVDLKIRSAT